MLQPIEWATVATKADLTALEERIASRLDVRLSENNERMTVRVVSWLVASQATLVASVGLLISLR